MELQGIRPGRKDVFFLVFSLVFAAVVFAVTANGKRITFCDEAYSYMITNSQAATVQFDTNVLYTREQVEGILSHSSGDGFIGMLKNVLSDKVHPPLYYVFMYISSMIASGSFSKWIGLAVNMVFLLGTVYYLWRILYHVFHSGVLCSLSMMVYVLNQSTLSDMMLIRMYMVMTFFTAAFAFYNIEVICKRDNRKIYPALVVTTAGGFLTQYYFAFFAAAFFMVEVLICIRRGEKNRIKPYFVSMLAAVGVSTVLWPFWIPCMFMNSHAGAIAGNLLDINSFLYKIYDGVRILQVSIFQKAYIVCGIAVMIMFAVFLFGRRIRKEKLQAWELVVKLIAGAFLYAMAVRVLTPEYLTSGRYYYPADMLEIAAIFICVYTIIEVYVKHSASELCIIAGVLLLVGNGISFYFGYGIDYYRDAGEYDEQYDMLKNYSDAVWIIAERETYFTDANIWDFCIPEYILFIDEESEYNEEYASLPEFSEADELVIITRRYYTDDGYIDYLDRGLYYFIGTTQRFVTAEKLFERNGLTYYVARVVEE